MTETEHPLIDDPQAPWNWRTVDEATAQSELGCELLYEYDGSWATYDEVVASVTAEADTIPADKSRWRDGDFDADEYIDEACGWGVIGTIEVRTRIATEYTAASSD
ncbi:hypothetical protein [Gordonia sp. KTR9]|uniref:hypothetical protein n=1 Tax=Gordonia sp. KTR9 TaxID=337191 RepID=UPI00027DE173|nr:hypothetical protein [Gordonia sp. KTR9]AFR49076.1 hypothetical protein KTR9_2439 [Gordonia sp. KTR9]